MPRRRLPLRRPASPLIRYSFLTLTLLALLTAQTGPFIVCTAQTTPAIVCAVATAITWKGHRTR